MVPRHLPKLVQYENGEDGDAQRGRARGIERAPLVLGGCHLSPPAYIVTHRRQWSQKARPPAPRPPGP